MHDWTEEIKFDLVRGGAVGAHFPRAAAWLLPACGQCTAALGLLLLCPALCCLGIIATCRMNPRRISTSGSSRRLTRFQSSRGEPLVRSSAEECTRQASSSMWLPRIWLALRSLGMPV